MSLKEPTRGTANIFLEVMRDEIYETQELI